MYINDFINTKNRENPLISVIVPVHNDPEGLKDTLKALVKQDFDKNTYEILIIDNNSEDNTPDVIDEYKTIFPSLIKAYEETEILSSYAARNNGILHSSGDIIAFIDSDMSVSPDWLIKIKKLISDKNIKYAGCNVQITLNNNSIIGLYNKLLGFKVENRILNEHYAPTCCLVIDKEIINSTGLFDSRLVSSGDYEFGHRVWKEGYKQVFAENILMEHPARNTLKKLLKKYFRTGRGKFQLLKYHPDIVKYENNIFAHHMFVAPYGFFKSIKKKIRENNLPLWYAIIFYFIKCLHRYASLAGYCYEKKIQRRQRNKYS